MELNRWKWMQIVPLVAGIFMIGMCWLTADVLLGVLALVSVSLTIWGLFGPIPEERVNAKIKSLQTQGLYPQGQATDEDVRRLMQAGLRVVAVRLYLQLHDVPLKQAIADVNQMA